MNKFALPKCLRGIISIFFYCQIHMIKPLIFPALMKFLEMNSIIKTNMLFSRLRAFDPKRTLEIEAYSCKQTKEQKRHKNLPKPLRFYISALELAFPDYDFSNVTLSSFKPTTLENVKKELSYVFFTIYKNSEDVSELLAYLDALLGQCVNLRTSSILTLDRIFSCDTDYYKVFILHDKKLKRILIIKSVLEK